MDLQQILQNIQSPEQIDALAARLAKFGRPPSGMPGMPQQQPQPMAQPNPMGVSPTPPAIPSPVPPVAPQPSTIGDILGGL